MVRHRLVISNIYEGVRCRLVISMRVKFKPSQIEINL
jgi:hypothetical protein